MTKLENAVQSGDIIQVRQILARVPKPSINDMTNSLFGAVLGGNIEIINTLIDAGANPNGTYNNIRRGTTVLIMAITAENDNYLNVIRLLLNKGADPNTIMTESRAAQISRGSTALIRLVRIPTKYLDNTIAAEAAKLLLDRGADPNIQNNSGDTALIIAARERKIDTVRTLIEHGADLNIKNDAGINALNYAYRNNDIEMFRLLKAQPTIKLNYDPELQHEINLGQRIAFNKVIGATPVELEGKMNQNFGKVSHINPTLISNIVGPFLGPKTGGRRKTKMAKRVKRKRTHKRRV